jgi:hypothetical protein
MTRRSGAPVVAAAMVLPLLLGACATARTASSPTTRSAAPSATATTAPPKDVTEKDFDRGDFPAAAKVDNRWYPLTPGTQYVLEGRSSRGRGRLPHRVVFTVTDLTKVIDGVRAVVIWDRDVNAGELQEAELAFQAQDNDGNVWLLGEYPEEYEGGKLQGADSTWISGVQGAKPGVLMRANPRPGTFSYLQGFAPAIEFQDRAKVARGGLRTCVPLGCYDDVLLVDEWNPLEPGDGHQLKYYASGVGNVRVGAVGDPEAEELVLVEVTRLGQAALAKVRREALALDRRAYRVRGELYRHTRPAA